MVADICLMTALVLIYPKACVTCSRCANLAFENHKYGWAVVFYVTLVVLFLRSVLSAIYMALAGKVKVLQWTNFLKDAIVLFPILIYTYKVRRDQDCLTCFNRM